jgi:hypothetical protein
MMPAYRSEAEGEVRSAVVDRLRALRPNARIMHEVNAGSFGNRIDVLAVDRAEIIAVEIKSALDKLDRLKDQLKAMKGCAHHAIAALHEKFLVEKETNRWSSQYERNGVHYMRDLPEGAPFEATWIYPEQPGNFYRAWRQPRLKPTVPLPAGALDMLWREELLEMCGRYSVCVPKRPTRGQMIPALRWSLSGRDLTLGICAALRSRVCIEADEPIEWPVAA